MGEISKHEAVQIYNAMQNLEQELIGKGIISVFPGLPAKVVPTYHKTKDGVEYVKTDGRKAAAYLRKLAKALEIE